MLCASEMSLGTSNPEKFTRPIAEKLRPVISAREATKELKEDVEATKKAKEFIAQKSLDLEVETRLGAMYLPPEHNPYRKEIYDRMLFGQKIIVKNVLAAELKRAIRNNPGISDEELGKNANQIIESWFAEIAKLDSDKNGKLNYEELIPQDEKARNFVERVFGTIPFFKAVENSPLFQETEPNTERNVPQKIDFIKKYISAFAEKFVDEKGNATEGSGRQLAELMETISLQVVGGSFLKNEDINKMWDELLQENKSVAAVYGEGDGRAQNKFEKLLEKEDVAIRQMRVDADKARSKLAMYEESGNPYGFKVRDFGSMDKIILYYGSNILFGAIALNVVLSGFNPKKMFKNPVLWGLTGLTLAAQKDIDPGFLSGKTPIEKVEQNELKLKFKSESTKQAVRNWLLLFSKKDFAADQPLGKMLNEKNRREFTSAELEKLVKEDERPDPDMKIPEKSDEARQLYLFLIACKQQDINPKSLDNA
ncbi:MAG: hypothetical protein V2A63_02015 [Patescibacteria group bacterium]